MPLPLRAALALDASVLAGAGDSVDTDETAYAWQLDFRKNFKSPFAVSASCVNEGHFRDHHLDARIPVRRTLDRPGELEPGNDRQRPR